ncbi:MAG TPA: cadherin-like domain-containing protein, partial [Thermoanaerobaculia bacterium]
MISMWLRGALFVLLSTLSGALAEAAPAVISVLVDADNDAESGCTAPGGATGFEQAFATTVDRTTLQVLTLERRLCAGNSFGDAVRLGGPWPATDGDERTHVELRLPFTELPPRDLARPMRLVFVFTDDRGTTTFTTDPDGSPILYPVASSARRRSARPADGTQFITIGGGIDDWTHVEPLFDRGLHTVFMIAGRGELYFRFDLRDGSQPPVAVDDAYSVPRGELLVVDAPGVLANDSDAEGSDLSAALAGAPAKGSVTLAPDGSFTYVHDGSTEPSDTFTYTVSDGLALSAPASVTINVSASNAPPVAVDDVFHVAIGGALDVTAPGLFSNDLDSDTPQSQWTVAVVAGPSHGNLTVGTGGAFTYVHDGSEADDSFTYQV